MSAIAPIQGMLARSAFQNVAIGLTSGLIAGYGFWQFHHVAGVKRRDAWYAEQAIKAKQTELA